MKPVMDEFKYCNVGEYQMQMDIDTAEPIERKLWGALGNIMENVIWDIIDDQMVEEIESGATAQNTA